jgi:excisionase family DNA binding protein
MSFYGPQTTEYLHGGRRVITKQARETLTVEETADRLGISRTLAYKAAQRGELPIIRIGRRLLVLKAELERMLMATVDPRTQRD